MYFVSSYDSRRNEVGVVSSYTNKETKMSVEEARHFKEPIVGVSETEIIVQPLTAYIKNRLGRLKMLGLLHRNIDVNIESCDLYLSLRNAIPDGTATFVGKKFVVPYGVEIIGAGAFQRSPLEQLILPETLTSLMNYCFDLCFNLEEVDIPSSLKYINSCAFRSCNSLRHIDLSKTKVECISSQAFEACRSLEDIKFPKVLEKMYDSAFSQCTSLKELDFRDTELTQIGIGAFYSCVRLERVYFPSCLDGLCSTAFMGCKSIKEIDLGGTELRVLRGNCFTDCTSLKRVILPSTLQSDCMGTEIFDGCSGLEEVKFVNSDDSKDTKLKCLSGTIFNRCNSLKVITLSSSIVDVIGLDKIQSLRLIRVPECNKGIEFEIPSGCEIEYF